MFLERKGHMHLTAAGIGKVARRALQALPLVLVLALGAACQPAVKQPPAPGRVALAGDSLSIQGGYYGGGYGDIDITDKIGLGWQAENAHPRVSRDVATHGTSPAVLIVALGQNDAANGLDQTDRQQLFALALAPADGACTVLVKPWYVGSDTVRHRGIADYRAWVDEMVALFPGRVHSVDWRPHAEQPGVLAADGYHLTETVGAPTYNAFIRSAPEACGGAS
jgi:hypothetical protein